MIRFSLISFLALTLCIAVPQESRGQGDEEESDSSDGLFHFAPETPEQLVRAVEIADQVRRPQDSKRYIRQLVNPLPTTDELVALRKKFGIGVFLDLYARPHLQPEAKQLLQAINESSRQVAPSVLRMEQLLSAPGDDTQSRASAVLEILSAGNDAVPVLLAADPAAREGEFADSILKRNTRELREGLYAQLASANSETRVRILNLLARTADATLVDRLLRWQFGPDVTPEVAAAAERAVVRLAGDSVPPNSREDAASHLSRTIVELLATVSTRFGTQDIPADQSRIPADADRQAGIAEAQTLAADLLVLTESDEHARALHLVAHLAMPNADAGDDVAGEEVLEEALEIALAAQNWPASTALLGIMRAGATADTSSLPDSQLLSAALVDRDPRVRIAAADLLLQSGQSEVASGDLTRQADAVVQGSLLPEAVVIDPRQTERIDGVTVLRGSGFEAVGAATGAEGFERAARQLQTELILVHSNCQRWPLTQLVANLRADARTAGVPVVVYGPSWSRDAVRAVAKNYAGVWFIEEPVTELTLFERLGWLRVPGPLLSPEERQQLKSMIVTSDDSDAVVSQR